jgi:hypothetical protein
MHILKFLIKTAELPLNKCYCNLLLLTVDEFPLLCTTPDRASSYFIQKSLRSNDGYGGRGQGNYFIASSRSFN